MIKYSAHTEKTPVQLLDELIEDGVSVGDTLFLMAVVDEDFIPWNVLAYTEGEERFPSDFTEEKATKDFLDGWNEARKVGV